MMSKKSVATHPKKALVRLIVSDGRSSVVASEMHFRGNSFHGYLIGNSRAEEVLKIAAQDRIATLCLGQDLCLPVRVDSFRRGRAAFSRGQGPKRGTIPGSYSEPIHSCRAEGDARRRVVVIEINEKASVLSVEDARRFGRAVLRSAKAVAA
jgi:hypothetical protein